MLIGSRWLRRWLAGALLLASLGAIGCGGGQRSGASPGSRREALLARVLEEPGDDEAWLQLAAEEDQLGRSAAALDALEQALLRAGPLGDSLTLTDRRRLGRLLYERGALRLRRGAVSALADLRRAAAYEWPVASGELLAAEAARAIAQLRHSAARTRAAGLRALAELALRPGAHSAWRGANEQATPRERAALGRYLWEAGAKRAGYELLAAAADAPGALGGDDRALYEEARRWWAPAIPLQAAAPDPAEPVAPAEPAPAPSELAPPGDRGAADRQALREAIAQAARRDMAVARRKAADYVATSADAALAWAELGALYLSLEDPASSRAAWQRAVDASDEPRLVRGLALATATAKDPDAALVFMTQAAAASGDPSPVLVDVAEALLAAGSPLHAMQAAKSAIDLATPDTARRALQVAYRAATALGRPGDAAHLVKMGATPLAPAVEGP